MTDHAGLTRNADVRWDSFPTDDYWSHNYQWLQGEDREILQFVGGFFASAFRDCGPAARAVDIGSGANLYPALLMLPWAERLTLLDYSAANVAWLRDRVGDERQPWTWQPFWDELCEMQPYHRIAEPRKQLREACTGAGGRSRIERGSVFSLAAQPRRWQLGTMFFVAESITEDPAEFIAAIGSFLGALEPAAPFAAAFMENSAGYELGGASYPALEVTGPDVEQRFRASGAHDLTVTRIRQPARIRAGYTGMIVATGRARSQ